MNNDKDRSGDPAEGQDTSLTGQITALRAEVTRCHQLIYVPGLWKCDACGFETNHIILNPATGECGSPRIEEVPKCPNPDGSTMRRVTFREVADGNYMAAMRFLNERNAALCGFDWTDKRPDQGGWFWVRTPDWTGIALITEYQDGFSCTRMLPIEKRAQGDGDEWMKEALWAGPLREPAEDPAPPPNPVKDALLSFARELQHELTKFIQENCVYDPTTGLYEGGKAADEWITEREELIEKINLRAGAL